MAGIWLVPDAEGCEKIKLLRDEGFRKGGVEHKIDFQPHVTMFSFGKVATLDELAMIIKAGRKKDDGSKGTKTIGDVELDFAQIAGKNTFYRSEMLQIHESPMLKALLDYFADILDLDKANETEGIKALKTELEQNPDKKQKWDAFNKRTERAKESGREVKYFPHISIMYLTPEDRDNTRAEDKAIDSDPTGKSQEITKPKLDAVTAALQQSYVGPAPGDNGKCTVNGFVVKKAGNGKETVYDGDFRNCKANEIWITGCPTTETKEEGGMLVMKTWDVDRHHIRLDQIKGLGDFVEKHLKENAEKNQHRHASAECLRRCVPECILCRK